MTDNRKHIVGIGHCCQDLVIAYSWSKLWQKNLTLRKDFFRYSLPALLNDLSWTVAFSTYSIILGHLGTDVVAAGTLTPPRLSAGCIGKA